MAKHIENKMLVFINTDLLCSFYLFENKIHPPFFSQEDLNCSVVQFICAINVSSSVVMETNAEICVFPLMYFWQVFKCFSAKNDHSTEASLLL